MSNFKSSILISGLSVCISLITTGCSQSNRYGMESSRSSEEDSDTEKVAMNCLPFRNTWLADSLHRAVEAGDIETVNQLCSDSRVDVNAKNDFDETPLHIAAGIGDVRVVEALLKHTNININVNEKDKKGYTPFQLAVKHGHTEIVRLLINDERVKINIQNKNRATSLHLAALSGSVEVVKELINHGAKINKKNRDGYTPLHLAALSGSLEVVKLLKEHPNIQINAKNNLGKTAFDLAKDKKIIYLLLVNPDRGNYCTLI